MKAADLFVRCYARKRGDQWEAFCVDFDLAAQADTYQEAESKLADMIVSYLHDALVGQDREHAGYLLKRRAPLKERLTFRLYQVLFHLGRLNDGIRKLCIRTLPLEPVACHRP